MYSPRKIIVILFSGFVSTGAYCLQKMRNVSLVLGNFFFATVSILCRNKIKNIKIKILHHLFSVSPHMKYKTEKHILYIFFAEAWALQKAPKPTYVNSLTVNCSFIVVLHGYCCFSCWFFPRSFKIGRCRCLSMLISEFRCFCQFLLRLTASTPIWR